MDKNVVTDIEYLPCQSVGELTPSKGDMVRSMAIVDGHGNVVHIDYQQMRLFQDLIILENLSGNLTILTRDAILQ